MGQTEEATKLYVLQHPECKHVAGVGEDTEVLRRLENAIGKPGWEIREVTERDDVGDFRRSIAHQMGCHICRPGPTILPD